jgi:hypothetical protein
VDSDVDEAPVAPWCWGANIQNIRIHCGFFRTGFRCSNRRQYSGSLLVDVGVTSLIIIGVGVVTCFLHYWLWVLYILKLLTCKCGEETLICNPDKSEYK